MGMFFIYNTYFKCEILSRNSSIMYFKFYIDVAWVLFTCLWILVLFTMQNTSTASYNCEILNYFMLILHNCSKIHFPPIKAKPFLISSGKSNMETDPAFGFVGHSYSCFLCSEIFDIPRKVNISQKWLFEI